VRAGGGPAPIVRAETAEQRDQLGVERGEPVGEIDRLDRSQWRRNVAYLGPSSVILSEAKEPWARFGSFASLRMT
jgi:hypothetical protein